MAFAQQDLNELDGAPGELDDVDGLELWGPHAISASGVEVDRLARSDPPVRVFSSYASWDEPDTTDRDDAAAWASRLGAVAVKFNVGGSPDALDDYLGRLRAFDRAVSDGTRLLCECHGGTVAEDPDVAAALFDAGT